MVADVKGWPLLHSKLPPQALKPLSESVYGVAGLTDVNEGYLIQRLFASELLWEWHLVQQQYLGFEDRTSQGGKNYRVYLASAHGVLVIEGREFHGAGGHDNRKLDAAYKGAATVAFKNACKLAGLTIELFKDGKAMDFIYDTGGKNPATREADTQGARTEPATPRTTSPVPPLAPAPVETQSAGGATAGPPSPRTPKEIADEARKHVRPAGAGYTDEDAVCGSCGRKEALRPLNNPRFCAKAEGGCGSPARGAEFQVVSWGEWKERQNRPLSEKLNEAVERARRP